MTDKLYAGIEAGGTKFICIVASGPRDIRARIRIDTTTPQETLGRVIEFFQKESLKSRLGAAGIASFGPLDLDPASPTVGFITNTPKPGWAMTDLAGSISKALDLPVRIDTDVNAAALAESSWGAGQGLQDFVYLTVGTGIEGGALSGGKLIHGLVHPEMGHMLIPHDRQADPYPGCCSFHSDCLEGMASGTSMQKRWGEPAGQLLSNHPAWPLEAGYLSAAIMNLICVLSPRRIILGGGVMQQPALLPLIRQQVKVRINKYFFGRSKSPN